MTWAAVLGIVVLASFGLLGLPVFAYVLGRRRQEPVQPIPWSETPRLVALVAAVAALDFLSIRWQGIALGLVTAFATGAIAPTGFRVVRRLAPAALRGFLARRLMYYPLVGGLLYVMLHQGPLYAIAGCLGWFAVELALQIKLVFEPGKAVPVRTV